MSGVAQPVPQKKLRLSRPRNRVDGDAVKKRRCVSFAELVETHFLREQALDKGDVYDGAAEDRYREFQAVFEHEHGRIVNAYWCSSSPSAVALTEKTGKRETQSALGFHRVSDWVTKDEPEIADALHECDELAVRAALVLRGKTQQICMRLVMVSATHLLSMVDGPAAHEMKGKKELALRLERRKLERARAYYHQAANGQAQLFYFAGMLLGAIALASLALLLAFTTRIHGVDDRDVLGSLTAGAIGAFVSVMTRIGSGQFRLDYDVGRRYPVFLGTLRPLIGAIFGLALYFAVTSSLLDVFKLPKNDNQRFYFLLVIAFIAGFSERWARDTLLSFGGSAPSSTPARDPKPRDAP